MGRYLKHPNYRDSLARVGFTVEQIDALDDPLVDSLVAIGDEDALRARVDAMLHAGADHVAVIPLAPDGRHADPSTTRALAPR